MNFIFLKSIYYLLLLAGIPCALYFFHKKTEEWEKTITDVVQKKQKIRRAALLRAATILLLGLLGGMLYWASADRSLLYCVLIAAIALVLCLTDRKK